MNLVQNAKSNSNHRKEVYLEIIRLFACYWVIFNHTNEKGFIYFTTQTPGTFQYWVSMLFSILCGISVPLFFMISGVTLLDKNESIKDLFRKRILRMVCVLFIFSLFYYIRYLSWDISKISIHDFFMSFLQEGIIIPYWYLYLYISFLLCLPFLRKIAQNMKEEDGIYLFLLAFVFNCILQFLQIKYAISINGNLYPNMILNTVFIYPILGYWIHKRKDMSTLEVVLGGILFILSIFIISVSTHTYILNTGNISEGSVGLYFNTFRMIQVVYIFSICKKVFKKVDQSKKYAQIILQTSPLVFGTYLIEQLFRERLYFIYNHFCMILHPFFSILLYVLFIQILCMFLTWIMKKLPFIRRLI